MEDYKDGDKRLDKSKYGNGQEFTEEGIIKFYAEKLGGQNHAKKKYEKSLGIINKKVSEELIILLLEQLEEEFFYY